MRGGTRGGDREGFALALVVFLLFAVGVAAATGYQVIASEFTRASDSEDGRAALSVARAGLERFVAEQMGVVGDSVMYAVGNGFATITSRKLYEADSLNHMYYLRSEGDVADPRRPLDPATRVVGTYALHRIAPVPHRGAVMATGGRLRVTNDAEIDGFDDAGPSECAGGGTAGVAGVATGGRVQVGGGGTLTGNPSSETFYSGFQEMYDTVGLRWDVLQDPDFPVEFEGWSRPPYGSLPPDSFPVYRWNGNLSVGSFFSGRGVFIVTGRLTMRDGFRWNGIILAGSLGRVGGGQDPRVDGIVVGGLDGGQPNRRWRGGRFRYHSCNVYAANRSLSYLERVGGLVVETN